MTRILAVTNQKGGVDKTTTSVNLATALCAVGQRVLLIDLDSQGNASTGLGIARAERQKSSYDLFFDTTINIADWAQATRVPKLSIIPGTIELSGAELELVGEEGREFRLREALSRGTLAYDYIVLDCPPSLSLITLNALVASDAVLIPLQAEFYALEGLSHLTKTIERVRKTFNPALEIQGLVLTMVDKRNRLSEQVETDVRDHFGDLVYKTVIPRNVRMSEAPSHGLPAIVYDLKCVGSQAYLSLARELIKRERSLAAERAA